MLTARGRIHRSNAPFRGHRIAPIPGGRRMLTGRFRLRASLIEASTRARTPPLRSTTYPGRIGPRFRKLTVRMIVRWADEAYQRQRHRIARATWIVRTGTAPMLIDPYTATRTGP